MFRFHQLRRFAHSSPPPKSNGPYPPSGRLGFGIAAGLGALFGLFYQSGHSHSHNEHEHNGHHHNKGPEVTKELPKLENASQELFNRAKVVFVLGGPGSGKGTNCSKLVNDYHYVHLSAGDLLREEQNKKDSPYGQLIHNYIKEGLIVPVEITLSLLKNKMESCLNASNDKKSELTFLIDGFPRKMDQALEFESRITSPSAILYFECPEEIMEQRLLERGQTSGRVDDTVDVIRKRFKTFRETSMPVVDYFEEKGKVVKVSCVGDKEEVYRGVVEKLSGLLEK